MLYPQASNSLGLVSCSLALSLLMVLPACSAAPATDTTEPPSDADILAKACSDDARQWTSKFESYCDGLERFPRPSYLNLPEDPTARGAVLRDSIVLELSAEGLRVDDGWTLDPEVISKQLELVSRATKADASPSTRYGIAADAMTPTSFVVDVMRRMHARGLTEVDLVAVTDSVIEEAFSPGSVASIEALQEVASVEDRKAQTLERVANAAGDDCKPLVTLYQTISVMEPRQRCAAMASSMPAAFEGCSCDADIDFVAASLMLPLAGATRAELLGSHTFTITPDGETVELNPEDLWNVSFFVLLSADRAIAPAW